MARSWIGLVVLVLAVIGLANAFAGLDASEKTALGNILATYPGLSNFPYYNVYGTQWTSNFDSICTAQYATYDYYGVGCGSGHVVILRFDAVMGPPNTTPLGDITGLTYVQEIVITASALLGDNDLFLQRMFALPNLKRVTIAAPRAATSYVAYSAGIPSVLSSLTNLTSLTISGSVNFKTIPSLANLTLLTALDLSLNDLAPNALDASTFAGMTALSTITVEGNARLASLPLTSANSALTVLNIKNTNISSLPDVFSTFSVFKSLDVSYCNALTSLPASLSSCTKLDTLVLSGSRLNSTDAIPDLSATLINLIKATDMNLNSGFPTGFCTFPVAKVTGIYLSNSKITDLPACFANYQALQLIDISSNLLPTFPSVLGSFPVLNTITADYNPMSSGSFPSTFGNLGKLRTLSAKYCGLTCAFPGVALANISTLYSLDVSFNSMTGGMPDNFFAKNILSSLNLQGNKLTGPFPSSVGLRNATLNLINAIDNKFTSLPDSIGALQVYGLYFSDNALTSIPGDAVWSKMPYLRELYLGGNRGLSSTILTFWGQSNVMQYVNMSSCSLVGNVPLFNSSSLREVYLQDNALAGTISGFVKANAMSILQLQKNLLTDAIPNNIGNMAGSLRSLDLSYNRLTGTLPPGFGSLVYLSNVRLNNNGISGHLPNMALFTYLQFFYGFSTQLDLCAVPAQFYGGASLSTTTCLLYDVMYPGSCFCASSYTRCTTNSTDCPPPDYTPPVAPPSTAPTPIRSPSIAPSTSPDSSVPVTSNTPESTPTVDGEPQIEIPSEPQTTSPSDASTGPTGGASIVGTSTAALVLSLLGMLLINAF